MSTQMLRCLGVLLLRHARVYPRVTSKMVNTTIADAILAPPGGPRPIVMATTHTL